MLLFVKWLDMKLYFLFHLSFSFILLLLKTCQSCKECDRSSPNFHHFPYPSLWEESADSLYWWSTSTSTSIWFPHGHNTWRWMMTYWGNTNFQPVRGGTVNFIFANIQHVSLDGAKERCLTMDMTVVFCSLEVHTWRHLDKQICCHLKTQTLDKRAYKNVKAGSVF